MEICSPRVSEIKVGTKPFSNLVVFDNARKKRNLEETDFGGKVVYINGKNRRDLFESFLYEASSLDSYEYFLFLDGKQKLSKFFYNNLSTWKPLIRYQIDVAVLKLYVGPIFQSRSPDYNITNFLEKNTFGPFLFSSRYIKDLYKNFELKNSITESINSFMRYYNLICFWPKLNLLFDNKKIDFDELDFPLILPDGIDQSFIADDYLKLYQLSDQKKVVYVGSSPAELIVLAQSACKIIAFPIKTKISFIDTKIWLERFGLEKRVEFVDPEKFNPEDESYCFVYSSYSDIDKLMFTKYLAYFPNTVFFGQSIASKEAELNQMQLIPYSQEIKVKA